jgi:hypothetical protein
MLHASDTQFNTRQIVNTSALCLVQANRCVQSFTFPDCRLSSVLCPTGHKTPATEHSQLLPSVDHYACVVVKKNIPRSPVRRVKGLLGLNPLELISRLLRGK